MCVVLQLELQTAGSFNFGCRHKGCVWSLRCAHWKECFPGRFHVYSWPKSFEECPKLCNPPSWSWLEEKAPRFSCRFAHMAGLAWCARTCAARKLHVSWRDRRWDLLVAWTFDLYLGSEAGSQEAMFEMAEIVHRLYHKVVGLFARPDFASGMPSFLMAAACLVCSTICLCVSSVELGERRSLICSWSCSQMDVLLVWRLYHLEGNCCGCGCYCRCRW